MKDTIDDHSEKILSNGNAEEFKILSACSQKESHIEC